MHKIKEMGLCREELSSLGTKIHTQRWVLYHIKIYALVLV